jgi:hypothetical protein
VSDQGAVGGPEDGDGRCEWAAPGYCPDKAICVLVKDTRKGRVRRRSCAFHYGPFLKLGYWSVDEPEEGGPLRGLARWLAERRHTRTGRWGWGR